MIDHRLHGWNSMPPTQIEREDLGRWIPMATSLSSFIRKSLESGYIEGESLPASVHHAATYFFSVALGVAKGSSPESDPQLGIANYCIVADTVRATLPTTVHDRASIQAHLTKYVDFATRLSSTRQLDEGDVEIATELEAFFDHLLNAGKAQRYSRYTGGSDSAPVNMTAQ